MDKTVYRIYTLFDITNTGTKRAFNSKILPFIDAANRKVIDYDSWIISRNQQRNFDTILQLLGMRAQISSYSMPQCGQVNLSNFLFGEKFKNQSRGTIWQFDCMYTDNTMPNPISILQKDFNKIPMILGLNQQLNLHNSYLNTIDMDLINIYFQSIV